MTVTTGDETIDEAISDAFHRLAMGGKENGNLISKSRTIKEAAFHDFSTYQYLFEPTRLFYPNEPDPGIAPPPRSPGITVDTWIGFNEFVSQFFLLVQGFVEQSILVTGGLINEQNSDYGIAYDPILEERRIVTPIAIDGAVAFSTGMAPQLYAEYRKTIEKERFVAIATDVVERWIDSSLEGMIDRETLHYDINDLYQFRQASFWSDGVPNVLVALRNSHFSPAPTETVGAGGGGPPGFGEILPSEFPFDPFLPGSVNFGLQTVYRQGWIPMGTQPGEIIRTLPLGPKQSEKITIKAIHKTKSIRTNESSTSVETSTESSAATKDSTEVVAEASESFNWHVEASASASFGFGSASLSAGAGGENAASSRDTKAALNETMEKTASKIRKDTKIVVSTEVEETSEFMQVSEISNPNDQIAVTYIYSRLQRLYEIYTYLSEVNMVVFVAEKIPSPLEITAQWIRRYDWVLSKVLLDESFSEDMKVVRHHDFLSDTQGDIDPNIKRMMETYSGEGEAGIPDYSDVPGTIPDMFKTPQETYEREVERRRARQADDKQYQRSLIRMRGHIYDNILHYCRAIWSSEDPDSRLLRYREILVPRKYQTIAAGSVENGSASVIIAPNVTDPDKDTVPLSDIINPAGPIGFAGNYAVYYLKESPRWQTLLKILDLTMAPFRKYAKNIYRDGIANEVLIDFEISPFRQGGGEYRIVRNDDIEIPFNIFQNYPGGRQVQLSQDVLSFDGVNLRFHAIRISVSDLDLIDESQSFSIKFSLLTLLEDPELKSLRWRSQPFPLEAAPAFFNPDIIQEMRMSFSEVFRVLDGKESSVKWRDLTREQQSVLISYYFDFQLRQQHTRRFVLDTNNVILTREVDDAATLEPYKEVHRLLDALQGAENLQQAITESKRRQKRVANDELGDPEIDRLTVVAGTGSIADLAALDGLDREPPTDGD